MIKKNIAYSLLFFLLSCSNIEFVLKDRDQTNPLKDKTLLVVDKDIDSRFARGLYSFFGNNKSTISFSFKNMLLIGIF